MLPLAHRHVKHRGPLHPGTVRSISWRWPHDHLFRTVFEDESEAAGLLRAHLPQEVSRELAWSSLKWQAVSFIDDRLRESESDLLYAVRRKAGGAPAWLYVLRPRNS